MVKFLVGNLLRTWLMQFILWAVWLWGKIFFIIFGVCARNFFQIFFFCNKKLPSTNKMMSPLEFLGAVKRNRSCFFLVDAASPAAGWNRTDETRGGQRWRKVRQHGADSPGPPPADRPHRTHRQVSFGTAVGGNVDDDDFPGVSLVETVEVAAISPMTINKKKPKKIFPSSKLKLVNWFRSFPPNFQGCV